MKILALICAVLGTAATSRAAELTVHAAASLTDALRELAPLFEKQSGDKLRFNFGASSQLARQIKEGAPADVFFSADEAQMNGLDQAGLLLPDTREDLLGNALVVIVPADSGLRITSAADLAKPEVKRVAVAEPSSVPAGVYTKEWLTKLGLWDKISPKVVPTENVRAALAAVESGNVEAGTVYRTDALTSKRVRVAYEAPMGEGPLIRYPAAALKGSKDPAAARRLLAFLGSKEARAIFVRHDFTVRK